MNEEVKVVVAINYGLQYPDSWYADTLCIAFTACVIWLKVTQMNGQCYVIQEFMLHQFKLSYKNWLKEFSSRLRTSKDPKRPG